jgi:hypothetical protein
MKLITWLFNIKSQSGGVYLWSTREITPYEYSCGRDAAHIAAAFSWGGNAEVIASNYTSGRSSDAIICGVYTAKILPVSFNGINLTLIDNIGKLEQITFSIIDQALDVSDFTGCKCVVSMSLDGIIKESWDFKIYNCYRENEKVTFLLKDWLYDLIQCEFPSNSGYDQILPNNEENYCTPFVFGHPYHELPFVRIDTLYSTGGTAEHIAQDFCTGGDAENIAQAFHESATYIDCYAIGDDSLDYTLHEIQSPESANVKEKYQVTSDQYSFISLEGGLLGVRFDIPGKGNPLYIVNGAMAPILCKYTVNDGVTTAMSPSFVLLRALINCGIPVDTDSIAEVGQKYNETGVELSGAAYKKRPFVDMLNDMLRSCGGKLCPVGGRYSLCVDPQYSIDETKIIRDANGKTSFAISRNEEKTGSGGYFQYNDGGPQHILSGKYAVGVDAETTIFNDETICITYITALEQAARAAIYYYQEEYLKKGEIAFDGSSLTTGYMVGGNVYFDSNKYSHAHGMITRKSISSGGKTRFELNLYEKEIGYFDINPEYLTQNQPMFIDKGGI